MGFSALEIVHVVEEDLMFKGLSLSAIEYLRTNGLWMPVTETILYTSNVSLDNNLQIYMRVPEQDYYVTFLIEHGEFLTGQVYDHIDYDAVNLEGYLHKYMMEDNSVLMEVVQTIHDGVVFLALIDNYEENIVIGWNDEDIETVLKNQKR